MKFSKFIRQILTILTLVLFIAYFLANKHKFRPLLDIDFWLLIIIAGADLSLIAVNGFFTKFILRPFGKQISILESFYVSLISSVGNFFAPVGAGFGFRAVYLKQKHGLSYAHYVSVLSGNYVIVFFVDAIFGLMSLLLLRSHYDNQFLTLLIVFLLVLAVSLVLSVVRIPSLEKLTFKNRYLNRAAKILHQITNGWNHLASHKRLMLHLLALTVVNFFITAFVTYIIITSLHLRVSAAALMLFAALSSMSLFINITPANLGVKEAIYIFSSSILGFSTAQILSIALIDRGVQFIVLLVSWVLTSRWGSMGPQPETSAQVPMPR